MMRRATSMIELVFAIVIMGIAMMTLPLILTQVQNNDAFAMQQEAILAAKTKIGDILSHEWDANSYSATAGHAYVLDAANGDSELGRVGTTNSRIGHVQAEGRRKFFTTDTNATDVANLGLNGTLDDVDDFIGTSPVINANPGTLDYIFDLTLNTAVTYAADSATYSASTLGVFALSPAVNGTSVTNIKTISVSVTGIPNTTITLRAFTCNIGETTPLASRPYQ